MIKVAPIGQFLGISLLLQSEFVFCEPNTCTSPLNWPLECLHVYEYLYYILSPGYSETGYIIWNTKIIMPLSTPGDPDCVV